MDQSKELPEEICLLETTSPTTGVANWRREALDEFAFLQTEDAQELLQGTFDGELTLPFAEITELMGPVLAGEFWIIGARPGCGKTTFCLNVLASVIEQERTCIYVGLETSPDRLRLQFAAWRLGLDYPLVAYKKWNDPGLPKDARTLLRRELDRLAEPPYSKRVIFANDERITLKGLKGWIELAHGEGLDVVMIDHLHRMDWGGYRDTTASMADGMRELKSMADRYKIRLIAAAQLKRPEQRDVLADHFPPSLSDIAQTGASEQEANNVVLLYKSLRPGVSSGDRALVTRGQKAVEEVVEQNVMRVRVGKCRILGANKDKEVRLYLHRGKLYDTDAARSHAIFEGRYGL